MTSNQTRCVNVNEKLTPKERQAQRINHSIQNDLERQLRHLDIERKITLNAKNSDINIQKRKISAPVSKFSHSNSSADLLIAHRRSSLELLEKPKISQSYSVPNNLCDMGQFNKSEESLEQGKTVCPYEFSGGIRMGNGCKRNELQDWIGLRDKKLKRTSVRAR